MSAKQSNPLPPPGERPTEMPPAPPKRGMTDDFRNHTLSLWTSNSFRRFHMQDGSDAQFACEPYSQHDGHADLLFPGGPDGPVARRFLATWNACRGIPTEALEQVPDFAAAGIKSMQSVESDRDVLTDTLRTVERDILALSEQIATGETSEQMRDQARAIAAKCAAALAGVKT